MDADIISTSIFVLGPQRGLEWVEHMENVEALFFYEQDGSIKCVMSSGVKDKVKL